MNEEIGDFHKSFSEPNHHAEIDDIKHSVEHRKPERNRELQFQNVLHHRMRITERACHSSLVGFGVARFESTDIAE